MVQVWFIRHGETDWNVQCRWQGHTDIPLNERGRKQAYDVAMYIKKSHEKIPFNAILTSDLSRAAMTAAIIGNLLNLPLHEDKEYREENYGCLEGYTAAEIHSKPLLAASLHRRKIGQHFLTDDGESREASLHRTAMAVDGIKKKYASNDRIVVVAHGGFIINVYRHIHGYPPGHPVIRLNLCPRIRNTSISIIRTDENGNWVEESWGMLPEPSQL